jgi:AraC-like DNA-binding protein
MRNTSIFPLAQPNPVVKQITVIREDDTKIRMNSMRFFADGLPGIMFHQSGYDVFLNTNDNKLSTLFLYGQTVKPIEISTIGPYKAIIFHLHAHVAKLLFCIDAHELTDACLDYSLLSYKDAPDLKNRLLDAPTTQDQINLVTHSLQNLLYSIKTNLVSELNYATGRIAETNGNISLKTLHNELKVSERTFERKFLQHVGVTPNLFRRICRFYAAFKELENNRFLKLTELAYNQGFADQSHFNRTFKEFTGYTPGEYGWQDKTFCAGF